LIDEHTKHKPDAKMASTCYAMEVSLVEMCGAYKLLYCYSTQCVVAHLLYLLYPQLLNTMCYMQYLALPAIQLGNTAVMARAVPCSA